MVLVLRAVGGSEWGLHTPTARASCLAHLILRGR